MAKNNNPGRILKGTKSQPSLKGASGVWTLDEALQYHRANQWPQPNLFQPVSNSLRFKYNANGGGLLLKNNSRGGDQRKWTYSCWVKRSLLTSATSDDFELFGAGWNNSYYGLHVNFQNANDVIQVYDWGPSGGGAFAVVTTPVFRDTSAWYHVVCSVDTTQATNTNRIKIWVNGVQVSIVNNASNNWGASGGFPNQGYATPANGPGLQHYVGATFVASSNAKQLDGYLSEVNFIDGAQLQPTLFGQFDTNNTWVPIPYTGSYGTNGFYLPFTNATTSQTLGYDASLTGTPTYGADQDPYRGSVSLHLTGNGPAGGQNNTFADSSPNNFAITRNGDATQGSFSPFPMPANAPYNPAINGASAYFDGTGDFLTVPANSAFNLGTGDFTIEFWAYLNPYVAFGGSASYWAEIIGINVGVSDSNSVTNTLGIWQGDGTGTSTVAGEYTVIISGSSANQQRLHSGITGYNKWSHVALTRSSGTFTLWQDGVSRATASLSADISRNDYVRIGKSINSGIQGSISNIRVIKGTAVYTAAFTPTNRPFGTLTNNLLTFSEDFTNYTTLNTSIISSAGVAPDGTPSATKLNASVSSSNKVIYYGTALTAGTYTASIYAKAGELQGLAFATGTVGMFVNLSTGTYRSSYSSTPTSYSVTPAGNGWYRCSFTFTLAATNSLYIGPNDNIDSSLGAGVIGTGSNGIYIWGAQLDSGTTLNNYTPTPANYSTAPSLLLNFANAAVVDSAGANNLVTVSNATITSASKYGSGALAFNGSSDYFQSSWSLNSFLSPGSNNWTLETWVYMTKSLSSTQVIVNYGYESSSTRSFVWYYNGDGTFRLAQSPDGSTNYDAGFGAPQGGFVLNTWYHLAIVRNFGAMTMYVNGKAMPNTLSAYTISSISTGVFRVGVDSSNYFGGAMDDLRLTKGVARYTTDFTPPARALPETGGKSFTTQNVNAGVVKQFTTTGTTSWTAPSDVTQVEVLVVAGGGAGGNNHAGGGGGGGLIYNNQYPVTPGQTYTVTVGSGGLASGTGANNNTNGGNSQFGALTAIGGGAGGNRNDTAGTSPGQNGGSGGGGGGAQAPYAGCYVAGLGTAGQGFSGGVAVDILGGGGGGAGGAGAAGSGTRVGGNGLQFGISGTPQYYAGGGGGSNGSAPAAAGGLGGGGTSGTTIGSNGTAGTANTGGGGGGGGAGNTTGSNGGSGIVLIRYTTTAVGNTSDATTDNLVDSPTLYGHDMGMGGEVVGNYATWNPLDTATSYLKNGNLSNTAGGANKNVRGTIAVSSGKWYWEFTIDQTSPTNHHGIWSVSETTTTYYIGQTAGSWGMYDSNGNKRNNGSFDAYGSAYTLNDIGMVALDMDNGKIWWGKNGVWFNSGVPASGTNAAFTNLGGYIVSPATLQYSAASYNFGQRAWAYTPPAGFNALTTKNLPRPTNPAIVTPNQYIKAVTWTGTGAAQTITTGFKPDFIWCKTRSNDANYPILQNTVKGITYSYGSNAADAPGNYSAVSAVSSTGFTLGTTDDSNKLNDLYIGYAFRAGGNSNTFNIDDVGYATASAAGLTGGTITPTGASVSTTAGFSIIKYNGDGNATATISHGLGIAPSMVWTKVQNGTDSTRVWHSGLFQGIDASGYLAKLNVTTVPAYDSQRSTGGTSSTFRIIGNATPYINSTGNEFVAFVWAEVPGFSKFGTYTANASTDGPFVYCGFKPAWVMVKNVTRDAGNWVVLDNALNTYNPTDFAFFPNTSARPGSTYYQDFVSNGFKLRVGSGSVMNNTAGDTYIFAAFADKPFGNANGTAR